jgi:hypothetical protein
VEQAAPVVSAVSAVPVVKAVAVPAARASVS